MPSFTLFCAQTGAAMRQLVRIKQLTDCVVVH